MSETRCIGGDALCPCNDGDACHYKDTPTTRAMPVPAKVVKHPSSHNCYEHIVIRRGRDRYVCRRCGWPVKLHLKPNEVLMRVPP
jgi:hypothetical protein